MNDLISIIVPVYNVEPYLRKCVDSILAQTYRNLEIILVNDGSPDRCGEICNEYGQLDARVRVIHKKNGGLSDARNAGLKIMNGKFVAFVDSDDWIDPAWCEVLLRNIVHFNADMSLGGILVEKINGDTAHIESSTAQYGNTAFCESNLAMMKRYLRTAWAAWDKLYRAELFDGIRYPVGEINEDEAIVLHLLDRCERVCYTNEVFYHYMKRIDGSSITTAAFSEKKMAWAKHCRDNLAFVREKYPELEADAAARYRSSVLWSLREISLLKTGMEDEWKQLRRELRLNFGFFWRNAARRDRILMILLGYGPRGLLHGLFEKRRKA